MACGPPGAGNCAPAEPTMAMVTAAVTPIKRCLISSTLGIGNKQTRGPRASMLMIRGWFVSVPHSERIPVAHDAVDHGPQLRAHGANRYPARRQQAAQKERPPEPVVKGGHKSLTVKRSRPWENRDRCTRYARPGCCSTVARIIPRELRGYSSSDGSTWPI